jgi:hypothetical protein
MAQASAEASASAQDRSKVSVVWMTLAFALVVLVAGPNTELLLGSLSVQTSGSVGARFGDCGLDYFCTVARVAPQGPMARAGVAPGDAVHPDDAMHIDHAYYGFIFLRPGETFGFTLRHGAAISHRSVVAEAPSHPPAPDLTRATIEASCLFATLLGAMLIARSRRRLSTVLIGVAFVCVSLRTNRPPIWASGPDLFPIYFIMYQAIFYLVAVPFIAFARQFRLETTGKNEHALRAVFWFYVVLVAVGILNKYSSVLLARHFLPFDPHVNWLISVLLTWLGFLLTGAVLFDGWRVSTRDTRRRYALMLVAIAVTMLLQVFGLAINLTGDDWRFSNPLVIGNALAPSAGVLLFAYAVLRHRVVDLGFAVNRGLVWGILSFVLLAAFGLMEWAIEHLIPLKNRETNVLLDAGAALLIFIVFHRVRDFIERHVEGLLFHSWRENAAALKAFVGEARYIGKPAVLTRAFTVELKRFTGAADCSVYAESEGHTYRQMDGEDAEAVDGDDPVLVKLRATHAVLETEHQLYLPMAHRGDLIGFVRLGLKPSGEGYRPDECEVLGWAVHQIGLDLNALKVEHLETVASEQKQENEKLWARIDELRLAMANPAHA